MLSVRKVLALAFVAGAIAGCRTDGLLGPEVAATAAKPRVIDTPATRRPAAAPPRTEASKSSDTQTAAKPETASVAASTEVTGSIKPAVAPATASSPPKEAVVEVPAQSLFGNWTFGEDGSKESCRVLLGAALVDAGYSARTEANCPGALASVRSWEIRGDELVLRNQQRAVVGRLNPTGPARFDGRTQSGAPVYLLR